MTGILSFRGIAAAVLAVAVTLVATPALAATTLFGPVDDTIINTTAFSTGELDASAYDSLELAFDYNSVALDANQDDSFSYGYTIAGSETVLGTVVGEVASGPTETGSVSVAIPSEALVDGLEVFISVTANSSVDNVVVTNISLVGELTPVVEEEAETDDEGDETATSTEDGTNTATTTEDVVDTDETEGTEDTATSTEDAVDTATTTDNGSETGSTTDDGTDATTTEDVVDTDETTSGTEEGDSSDTTTTDSDAAADRCEFEGHKYDTDGNPLAGWEIGLMKVVTHNNGTDLHVIDSATTDADGFYCLRWQDIGENTLQGESTYVDGPYSFEYRVYEVNQADWEFNSAETGAVGTTPTEVGLEDLTFTSTQVQVQVVEEGGFVIADAEYHVDFYNRFTGTTTNTGGGNGSTDTSTSTATTTDPTGSVAGTSTSSGGGSSSARCEAFTVESVDGQLVMEWETRRGNDLTISADGVTVFTTDVDDVIDEGTASIADAGQTSFELVVSRGSRDDSCTVNFATGNPTVAGISDSTPEPMVLGEQVSAVPLGGANTGAGGASSAAPAAAVVIAALAGALATLRRSFNV